MFCLLSLVAPWWVVSKGFLLVKEAAHIDLDTLPNPPEEGLSCRRSSFLVWGSSSSLVFLLPSLRLLTLAPTCLAQCCAKFLFSRLFSLFFKPLLIQDSIFSWVLFQNMPGKKKMNIVKLVMGRPIDTYSTKMLIAWKKNSRLFD